MNDKSIIELFRNRDEQAITELKLKYDRLCCHIAGNILSQREDIEECINTAYYDIWNRVPPDEPDDLKTYLCRIVKNKAIDRLKYNTAAKRSKETGGGHKPLPANSGRASPQNFRAALLVRRQPFKDSRVFQHERENSCHISFSDKKEAKGIFEERGFRA